jgi:hypothetical protein
MPQCPAAGKKDGRESYANFLSVASITTRRPVYNEYIAHVCNSSAMELRRLRYFVAVRNGASF